MIMNKNNNIIDVKILIPIIFNEVLTKSLILNSFPLILTIPILNKNNNTNIDMISLIIYKFYLILKINSCNGVPSTLE